MICDSPAAAPEVAAELLPLASQLLLVESWPGRRHPATADAPVAGPTPFIASVTLRGSAMLHASTIRFTIAPQPGSASKAVSASYSIAYLTRRGYASPGSDAVQVPVFGLYDGYANAVALAIGFDDGTSYTLPGTIQTAAYVDPNQIYSQGSVVQARAPGSALGFDFLYMKSNYGSPVVIDTDGRTRWVGPGVIDTLSMDFQDGGFIMGAGASPLIYRVEMDGAVTQTGSLASSGVVDFNHDIEPGKVSLLDNVDATIDGVSQIESTAQEFTTDGTVLATWDMAKIISAAMVAGGDDPTQFVRPGIDWFHLNTAIYDASDDSVILSSRENFVIKLDYTTGAIRWIFGDPTKYWYTFPSLRSKALTLVGPGLVPIGQHSVGIAHDGSLLLFNDGFASLNQPAGAPAGASRTYSAVSDYVIDATAATATQAWSFDHGQTLYSSICSSARAAADGSVLVDYAEADSGATTHIVGLDPNHGQVFEYTYPNAAGCNTAWNAQPIAMESLAYD